MKRFYLRRCPISEKFHADSQNDSQETFPSLRPHLSSAFQVSFSRNLSKFPGWNMMPLGFFAKQLIQLKIMGTNS